MRPELLKQAENYVRILLEENLSQASSFHNVDHKLVVHLEKKAAEQKK